MLGVGGKNDYETGEEADGADVIRGGTATTGQLQRALDPSR